VARGLDIRLFDVNVGRYSVTVSVHPGDDGRTPWWLTVIYGPHEENKKGLFLDELEAIKDACPRPWVVLGDFNLILDEANKNNDNINRRTMSSFR
jgi:hypothetical protein